MAVYRDFGFTDVKVKIATRPDHRIGSDKIWDESEAALEAATKAAGLEYVFSPGDGAFYGPKLEFALRDSIGRDWQCGTLQVDYNTAERLGASYIGEDGGRHAPVMLHRAVLGSMERFIGVLIEHYAGAFPVWLAPLQARIVPISEKANDYARQVQEKLLALPLTGGMPLRVDIDMGNERMQKKIRDAQLQKIPYMLVVGEREAAEGKVAVRLRSGTDLGGMALETFLERIKKEVESRHDVAE
jgi:threonyl-tRNA synthetase